MHREFIAPLPVNSLSVLLLDGGRSYQTIAHHRVSRCKSLRIGIAGAQSAPSFELSFFGWGHRERPNIGRLDDKLMSRFSWTKKRQLGQNKLLLISVGTVSQSTLLICRIFGQDD